MRREQLSTAQVTLVITGAAIATGFEAGAAAGALVWLLVAIASRAPAALVWTVFAAVIGGCVGVAIGTVAALALGIYVGVAHGRQPVQDTAHGIVVLSVVVTAVFSLLVGGSLVARAGGAPYLVIFLLMALPLAYLSGRRLAGLYERRVAR